MTIEGESFVIGHFEPYEVFGKEMSRIVLSASVVMVEKYTILKIMP